VPVRQTADHRGHRTTPTWRRAQCGAITATVINRGDHHFRETATDAAQLLPPPIDLSGTNVSPTGDISDIAPGAKAAETIARFCSSLHDRRRSGPVIIPAFSDLQMW
jgi:hypothetical protein